MTTPGLGHPSDYNNGFICCFFPECRKKEVNGHLTAYYAVRGLEEIYLLSFSVPFNYSRNSAPYILWCKPDVYHSDYNYDVLQRFSVKRGACSDKARHFFILRHDFIHFHPLIGFKSVFFSKTLTF